MFEQAKGYADNRIIESQDQTLRAITDVSASTKRLALIVCHRGTELSTCYDQLYPEIGPDKILNGAP